MNQLPPAVSEHHRREIFFAEIADLGIQRDQALHPDELLRILDNRLVTLFSQNISWMHFPAPLAQLLLT
jgi:hypothetical protein